MRLPACELSVTYRDASVAEDVARFQQACQWVAREFRMSALVVSLAIVDDDAIHVLNRDHLDHDWPTDVISFVFSRDEESADGEIIASAETARRVSKSAGWSAEDELLLYVVHGLLHLAGMDDQSPVEQTAMREAERKCLLELGVAKAQSHIDRWEEIA